MFKLITFLLGLATFFVTSNAQKDINCPRHFVPFNVSGKCYFVSDSLVSYPWAVELCEQLDAEVYVSNFYERNTIREFILKYLTFDYYWIGVHKVITNYSNNEGYWVYQNGSRVGHYYPWDYHYKIKPANEMNRTYYQGDPHSFWKGTTDILGKYAGHAMLWGMYMSDSVGELGLGPRIDDDFHGGVSAFGFTPYSRIWSYPLFSGGAGSYFDEFYDKHGWSGHAFRPFGSALFQYCVFESGSIQGAVWSPMTCWGTKLGAVCVRDPIEDEE